MLDQTLRPLTSLDERAKLAELAEDGICLEIGSYDGASTIAIACTARFVICVDPFMVYDGAGIIPLLENWYLNTRKLSNVILFKMRSQEFGAELTHAQPPFDMIFVDGSHNYEDCKYDLLLAHMYLKKGGYLTIHDVDGSWPGVNQAIEEMEYESEMSLYQRLNDVDVMGVWQKVM